MKKLFSLFIDFPTQVFMYNVATGVPTRLAWYLNLIILNLFLASAALKIEISQYISPK